MKTYLLYVILKLSVYNFDSDVELIYTFVANIEIVHKRNLIRQFIGR